MAGAKAEQEICTAIFTRTENKRDEKNAVLAAIYARTSSPNQRFGYSMEEQIRRCWDYCDKKGWRASYVFKEDGVSGGTIERPKFQMMLERAKAGAFDVIIFWKLDRFCRSLVDLVNVERQLREWGVGLCSVTEYIDTTTSVGRFNYRNLASVAELERELIGERARMGMFALAKQHKWPNDHPPLGYDKTEDGGLKVNKKEARLVRRIFKRYVKNRSIDQVAFELNKENILTKKGKPWNSRAVRDVLANELYTGAYRVAGVDDVIEECRIIKDELFEKATKTMHRFKDGGAKRSPMPDDRRKAKIDRIFNEYFELLKEAEGGNQGKRLTAPPLTRSYGPFTKSGFTNKQKESLVCT